MAEEKTTPEPTEAETEAPEEQYEDPFKATMDKTIEHAVELKQEGEGFILSVVLKTQRSLDLDAPPPEAGPGAQKVNIATRVNFGGRTSIPPKLAIMASIAAIIQEMKKHPQLGDITIQDIAQMFGQERPKGRIMTPGSPGFGGPIPGGGFSLGGPH